MVWIDEDSKREIRADREPNGQWFGFLKSSSWGTHFGRNHLWVFSLKSLVLTSFSRSKNPFEFTDLFLTALLTYCTSLVKKHLCASWWVFVYIMYISDLHCSSLFLRLPHKQLQRMLHHLLLTVEPDESISSKVPGVIARHLDYLILLSHSDWIANMSSSVLPVRKRRRQKATLCNLEFSAALCNVC